jgi:hypothetical protein
MASGPWIIVKLKDSMAKRLILRDVEAIGDSKLIITDRELSHWHPETLAHHQWWKLSAAVINYSYNILN